MLSKLTLRCTYRMRKSQTRVLLVLMYVILTLSNRWKHKSKQSNKRTLANCYSTNYLVNQTNHTFIHLNQHICLNYNRLQKKYPMRALISLSTPLVLLLIIGCYQTYKDSGGWWEQDPWDKRVVSNILSYLYLSFSDPRLILVRIQI